MEINSHNISRAHLINELIRGIELARQLRAQMGPEYSPQIKNNLLEQILSSYDKALFILRCGALSEQPHQLALATSPPLPSSLKRKSASTWTNKVKMNPENGLDGPPNDGYSWRKYGQKDILGSKNPRSYYKCTYRSVQDCWATRQVQRSDEDPTIVEITYRGKHTCNEVRRSKSAPTLPAKQEPKQDLSIDEYQEADLQNMDSFPSAGLGIFANVQHQLQFLEGGIGDVVLGATSSINSPAITPEDFMLDEGFFS